MSNEIVPIIGFPSETGQRLSNQGTHWHELVPVKPRGVNSMSIIGSFNSNWGLRCHAHFWWFKLLSNGVIVLFLVVSWFGDLLVGH